MKFSIEGGNLVIDTEFPPYTLITVKYRKLGETTITTVDSNQNVYNQTRGIFTIPVTSTSYYVEVVRTTTDDVITVTKLLYDLSSLICTSLKSNKFKTEVSLLQYLNSNDSPCPDQEEELFLYLNSKLSCYDCGC